MERWNMHVFNLQAEFWSFSQLYLPSPTITRFYSIISSNRLMLGSFSGKLAQTFNNYGHFRVFFPYISHLLLRIFSSSIKCWRVWMSRDLHRTFCFFHQGFLDFNKYIIRVCHLMFLTSRYGIWKHSHFPTWFCHALSITILDVFISLDF